MQDSKTNARSMLPVPELSVQRTIKIRFYDVDSIQIVWHGHYMKYLEDGREAFGEEFNLSYKQIYDSGYTAPIVDFHLRYLNTVSLGETIQVTTTYVKSLGAKLVFDYAIHNAEKQPILQARSIQLFMDRATNSFEPSTPEFYKLWKLKHKVA